MKVIEQLTEYLSERGLLTAENCEWLRAQGFLKPSDDDEARSDSDLAPELFCESDDLDGIEEELRQRDLLRKAELQPRSSKGSRRARRQRTNARSEGRQAREVARRLAEEETLVRLNRLAASSAVPALMAALQDSRAEVRCTAARLIEQLGSPAADVAAPALKIALADTNTTIALAAASALSKTRCGETFELAKFVLLAAAMDRTSDVCLPAISTIGRIGPPAIAAFPTLLSRVADPDSLVCNAAKAALLRISPPADAAVVTQIAEMANRDHNICLKAAVGLGNIGSRTSDTVVAALGMSLNHADQWVRHTAAAAIGRIGRPLS